MTSVGGNEGQGGTRYQELIGRRVVDARLVERVRGIETLELVDDAGELWAITGIAELTRIGARLSADNPLVAGLELHVSRKRL